MRAMLPLFALFLLSVGTSARADGPTVSVDWRIGEGTNRHAAVIAIKNLSGQELTIQHPGNRRAILFTVTDDQGNVITPMGVAKVDPRHRNIVLKAGETFEHTDSQWCKLAQDNGLTLPFLTGTGLFACKLIEGHSYRVTVIYRPSADSEGVASAEKVWICK
jgi:hypothetical protein